MTADEGPARVSGKLKGILPYAALLAGAVYLYFAAGHFVFTTKPGELGPDIWPKAILLLSMAVCAYEIVRRALFLPEERAMRGVLESMNESAAAGPEEEPATTARHPLLLLAAIVLTILYVLVLDVLGFFMATFLYLALFMAVGRYRRIGVILATSIVGSLVFVFVFMKIVYVSLPLGIGPFQTLSVWIFRVLGIR